MSKIYHSYLLVFLISFVASLALVPVSRFLAFHFKVLDEPDKRKRHGKTMPYLGGLAVLVSFNIVIVSCLFGFFSLQDFSLFREAFPWLVQEVPLILRVLDKLIAVLVGSVGMFCLGLTDDILGARFDYRVKFLFQIVIAFSMTFFGIRTDFLENVFLDTVFTVLWIVGITNAFNLLDNMDGISSGVAYICTMFLFFIAAKQEQYFMGLAYISFAGALLGFLYFNFPPAKIFLGDAGALFIGFLISTFSVLQSFGTSSHQGIFPILMPVCILALPIFDTARVIFIRLYEKRPLFQGDRRHITHRLVEMGLGPKQTVFLVYLLTLVFGMLSIPLEGSTPFISGVLVLQILFIILALSLMMAWTKK